MSLTFVDTHAHLAMLTHAPLADILDRAEKAGISRMITVSTEETNWEPNRELAERLPHVYYSVGLHPHEAKDWPKAWPVLERYAALPPKLVAVGETGLDFHYTLSPKEAQLEAFEAQVRLAKLWNLPLIVHCREAFEDLFAILRKVGVGERGGVMHCFTGTTDEAKRSLDLGFKISFSGIVTFKNAAALRETAQVVPAESLLIETDCPFLAPIPNRGKPNEPAFLPLTASVLAETRGVSVQEIAHQTTQNAVEFFGLH